jgi:hypothetical protein
VALEKRSKKMKSIFTYNKIMNVFLFNINNLRLRCIYLNKNKNYIIERKRIPKYLFI